MKRLKKTFTLLIAVLFCVLPLFSMKLTVSANEPITYYLKYFEESNEWRYQQLTYWDDTLNSGELQYVLSNIKDGDTLVINGDTYLELKLNVHLKNLTVLNVDSLIITANGIDEYYQHDGMCAINSDVTDAYVHGETACNFNKNVKNLNIFGTDLLQASVNALGTVSHLKASANSVTHYEFYDFAAGKLCIDKGTLKTAAEYYSSTPSSASAEAPASSAPAATTSASGEYDEVPKTGDNYTVFLLLGIAGICLCCSYRLRSRA